ncbi:MAG: aspartate/glutamate racemase family protein [Bacteroidetes bacterium]|nr:aspartate/glutamate racemase family protein [Bacteroidota bacterium]
MFGWRGKIGLIVPSNNTLIETEIKPILPEGVILHVTKIHAYGFDTESIIERGKNANRAVQELSADNVDVIIYCCLATSLIMGKNWNKEFTDRTSELRRCPIITAFDATVTGLKELNLSKIGLVSPYPRDVHKLLPKAFAKVGIQVVAEVNNPIEDIDEVPKVNPSRVYDMARKVFSKVAEGICIVATDLPTSSVIQALEADLGIPVVTTNQAIIYVALKQIGVNLNLPNYGMLLKAK